MTIVKKAFLGLTKKLSEEYLWGNIKFFYKRWGYISLYWFNKPYELIKEYRDIDQEFYFAMRLVHFALGKRHFEILSREIPTSK